MKIRREQSQSTRIVGAVTVSGNLANVLQSLGGIFFQVIDDRLLIVVLGRVNERVQAAFIQLIPEKLIDVILLVGADVTSFLASAVFSTSRTTAH